MLQIVLQGEKLVLLPGRAIYWPAQHTLIVADLHWGKTAHFRKHGIAVPMNAQQKDEIRLAQLVQQHKAERLIVAGDMFHSVENNEVDGFAHWRAAHSQLRVDLVIGNHDILPVEKYALHNIIIHDELLDTGPFIISHDVMDAPEKFYIHGHLHPAYTINSKGRNTNIKLPCFCMDDTRLVLPAFGSFTGSYRITSGDYKNIYVVAEDEVIQWQ